MINEHLLLPNNAVWLQIKNLWYLPDQNSNFGGAQRVTTKNATTVLYLYLTGTKFIEMINTAVAWQACRDVSCYFIQSYKKALPLKKKYHQNRFHKKTEGNTHIVQVKPKSKISCYLLCQHKPILQQTTILLYFSNKFTQLLLQY